MVSEALRSRHWPFVVRTRRPVPAPIGKDNDTGQFSQSNPCQVSTAIARSRVPGTESAHRTLANTTRVLHVAAGQLVS